MYKSTHTPPPERYLSGCATLLARCLAPRLNRGERGEANVGEALGQLGQDGPASG